jgi:hypothetical protein
LLYTYYCKDIQILLVLENAELLIGYIIFADTSKNCVHLYYPEYFDYLETLSENGGVQLRLCAFTRVSTTTAPLVSTVTCYMTQLQVTNFIL